VRAKFKRELGKMSEKKINEIVKDYIEAVEVVKIEVNLNTVSQEEGFDRIAEIGLNALQDMRNHTTEAGIRALKEWGRKLRGEE